MASTTSHITNAREKIAEVAHRSGDQISESTDHIKKNVRTTAANVEKTLRDASHKAKLGSEQITDSIQQFVSKHPIASVTVACLVAATLLTALTARQK